MLTFFSNAFACNKRESTPLGNCTHKINPPHWPTHPRPRRKRFENRMGILRDQRVIVPANVAQMTLVVTGLQIQRQCVLGQCRHPGYPRRFMQRNGGRVQFGTGVANAQLDRPQRATASHCEPLRTQDKVLETMFRKNAPAIFNMNPGNLLHRALPLFITLDDDSRAVTLTATQRRIHHVDSDTYPFPKDFCLSGLRPIIAKIFNTRT